MLLLLPVLPLNSACLSPSASPDWPKGETNTLPCEAKSPRCPTRATILTLPLPLPLLLLLLPPPPLPPSPVEDRDKGVKGAGEAPCSMAAEKAVAAAARGEKNGAEERLGVSRRVGCRLLGEKAPPAATAAAAPAGSVLTVRRTRRGEVLGRGGGSAAAAAVAVAATEAAAASAAGAGFCTTAVGPAASLWTASEAVRRVGEGIKAPCTAGRRAADLAEEEGACRGAAAAAAAAATLTVAAAGPWGASCSCCSCCCGCTSASASTPAAAVVRQEARPRSGEKRASARKDEGA
jgi:hypothetical protein